MLVVWAFLAWNLFQLVSTQRVEMNAGNYKLCEFSMHLGWNLMFQRRETPVGVSSKFQAHLPVAMVPHIAVAGFRTVIIGQQIENANK